MRNNKSAHLFGRFVRCMGGLLWDYGTNSNCHHIMHGNPHSCSIGSCHSRLTDKRRSNSCIPLFYFHNVSVSDQEIVCYTQNSHLDAAEVRPLATSVISVEPTCMKDIKNITNYASNSYIPCWDMVDLNIRVEHSSMPSGKCLPFVTICKISTVCNIS